MRCQSEPLPQIMIHLSLFNHELMRGCVSGGCCSTPLHTHTQTHTPQEGAHLSAEEDAPATKRG